MAIDALARKHHIPVKARRGKALVGEGAIDGEQVILLKPLTFMNLSGQAVGNIFRRHRLSLQDLIVICDDVNLPLGKLRIRASGSAGGHNGLKSIIYSLQSEDFARVRIGIGAPNGDMVDHVLSRFARPEKQDIDGAIKRAAESVEVILRDGVEQAMNLFNYQQLDL